MPRMEETTCDIWSGWPIGAIRMPFRMKIGACNKITAPHLSLSSSILSPHLFDWCTHNNWPITKPEEEFSSSSTQISQQMNLAPTNLPRRKKKNPCREQTPKCSAKVHTQTNSARMDFAPFAEIRVPHPSPTQPPQPWEQKDHVGNCYGNSRGAQDKYNGNCLGTWWEWDAVDYLMGPLLKFDGNENDLLRTWKRENYALRALHMSQPHFGLSVRMKLTLPKVGTWSPLRLLKIQSLIAGV
jgi:hypothetical protein